MVSYFFQRIPGEYSEDVGVESDDVVDEMIFKQVGIKTREVINNPHVLRGDQDIGRGRFACRDSSLGLGDVSIVGLAAHGIDV